METNLLQQLKARLIEARRVFIEGENAGRAGAILALDALTEFIQGAERANPEGLALPVAMVLSALKDLDDGKQLPLLKPIVFGNRPPDARAVQHIRAFAAFTMGRLMLLDSSKVAASRDVAEALKRAGFPFHPQTKDAARTVASWRNRLSKVSASGAEADMYRDILDASPKSDASDHSPKFSAEDCENYRLTGLRILEKVARSALPRPSN